MPLPNNRRALTPIGILLGVVAILIGVLAFYYNAYPLLVTPGSITTLTSFYTAVLYGTVDIFVAVFGLVLIWRF